MSAMPAALLGLFHLLALVRWQPLCARPRVAGFARAFVRAQEAVTSRAHFLVDRKTRTENRP